MKVNNDTLSWGHLSFLQTKCGNYYNLNVCASQVRLKTQPAPFTPPCGPSTLQLHPLHQNQLTLGRICLGSACILLICKIEPLNSLINVKLLSITICNWNDCSWLFKVQLRFRCLCKNITLIDSYILYVNRQLLFSSQIWCYFSSTISFALEG